MDLNARDKARDLVRADLAIDSTVATALDFAEQAREALTPLPSTPAVYTLQATCDLLANRMSSFR